VNEALTVRVGVEKSPNDHELGENHSLLSRLCLSLKL